MQGLTPLDVIDSQIPAQRVDPQAVGGGDEVNGALHLVEHGQHRARGTWIAGGHPVGEDEAGSGLRHDTGVAAKLGGAVALACDDGGNRWVLGMDDFALGKLVALGEALRLLGDMPLRGAGSLEVPQQALALGRAPGAVVVQELSGLLHPALHGITQLAQVPLGCAHQLDKDFALASALAAKAAQDLFQGLAQCLSLDAQGLGRRGALTRDRLDASKIFF